MRSVLFVAAGLVALYLIITKWPQPKPAPQVAALHSESFARQLFANPKYTWKTHQISHGHIHFIEHSHAARTRTASAVTTEAARTAALEFLQLTDTLPIEVFFVDTREQMRELVGNPIGGMVQSGERTALLMHSETYAAFLNHELTHLYTHYNWGPPRHGRWISEGIAALANGDCQGHSLAALVKGLHEDKKLRTWSELRSQFDSLDEVSANLQAASIVAYVRKRGGIRAVQDLWMANDWSALERTFRAPLAEVEADWLASVTKHPEAARLDIEALRKHGCVAGSAGFTAKAQRHEDHRREASAESMLAVHSK